MPLEPVVKGTHNGKYRNHEDSCLKAVQFFRPAAQHYRRAGDGGAGGDGRTHGRALFANLLLALGGGAYAIGPLQAMDNFLSALYSFPGRYLSDRFGTKKSLLIFNIVAMCGFALVILIPTWQPWR